jgi:hypothetical protein
MNGLNHRGVRRGGMNVLPIELQVDVLTTWLLLVDVAMLDTAFCNHRDRQQWLVAFTTPIYNYVHPYFQIERLKKKTHYSNAQKLDAMMDFMRWLLVRSVRVREIYVMAQLQWYAYEWSNFKAYLRTNGGNVTRVIFAREAGEPMYVCSALEDITKLCPNVTHVACAKSFIQTEYERMAVTWPLLQAVVLHGYYADEGLKVVGNSCGAIQSVTLIPYAGVRYGYRDRTLTETFPATVSTTLAYLHVDCHIDNVDLLLLTQRCPLLHTLHGVLFELTDAVLMEIADRCPLLRVINLSESPSVTTKGIAQFAQRVQLTELYTSCLDKTVVALLPHLRTWQVTECENTAQMSLMMLTVAAHCVQLREFKTSQDVNEPALIALVTGCRLLETLEADKAPTDAVLNALSLHCPYLSSLHLRLHAGVCALGRGCPRLRGLSTRLAAPVTMAGIRALATHCRRLHVIHVNHSVVRGVSYRENKFMVCKLRVIVG